MKRYLSQLRLVCQLMCLCAVVTIALPARTDTWSGPAAGLATQIVGKVGPGSAIALTINSRSSLSSTDVRSIKSQVESQLRAARMEIVAPAQAVATVIVTLSENSEGYLWVAEIQQGSGSEIVMLPVARQQWEEMRNASALTLRRKLLLVQDEPILDVELRPESAVVLSPGRVTWYRVKAPNWEVLQRSPLDYRRGMPRDLRGRLWSNGSTVLGVSLPGVRCTQASAGAMSLSCTETDDPWPIASGASIGTEAFFSPVRNFFNGTVAFYDPQKQAAGPVSHTVPAFYSLASVVEDGLPLWLFASVDGRVTFFGGKTGTVPKNSSIQGWGSDVASVASSCGPPLKPKEDLNGAPTEPAVKPAGAFGGAAPELFVIATRAGDRSRADAVQAFQIVNREAVAVASEVEFAGPITALWTSAVDNATAIAVSQNLATGEYEAYSLSLVCNQ